MWVKALDLLMDRLRITGLDFHDVVALSGAGQVKVEINVAWNISILLQLSSPATWKCLLEERSRRST